MRRRFGATADACRAVGQARRISNGRSPYFGGSPSVDTSLATHGTPSGWFARQTGPGASSPPVRPAGATLARLAPARSGRARLVQLLVDRGACGGLDRATLRGPVSPGTCTQAVETASALDQSETPETR